MLNKWMEHIRLPKKIIDRVIKYQECLWTKFKGNHDNEILNEIPETIKNDVLIYLLKEFKK